MPRARRLRRSPSESEWRTLDALGRAAVDGVVQRAAGVEDGAAGGLVGDAERDGRSRRSSGR